MNYDYVKFHEVLFALNITGWSIPTAPTTEAYFLANFERQTGMGTNDMDEPMGVYSSNPSDFGVTWSQITTKHAELVTEYNNKEYARKRKAKYDALNQFELISDDAINGTTTHKDAILAIKSEFPKP